MWGEEELDLPLKEELAKAVNYKLGVYYEFAETYSNETQIDFTFNW